MAELAVPLIALGSMFIMSKQKKNSETSKREGFLNMSAATKNMPDPTPPISTINYPVTLNNTFSNGINNYKNPNQYTDKYFIPTAISDISTNNTNINTVDRFQSMSGQVIDKSNFVHNNTVPFYGSKIKGPDINRIGDSVLDTMQGQGSQYYSKKEQAPLFNPNNQMQYANGTPNQSDFIKSRINPSMRMANVKPWVEQQVAPGLNKGFNAEGGSGFNNGTDSRELWLDKTVDQLRVDSHPKISYELAGHEGGGSYYIKNPTSVHQQGKVEKYLPDKFYTSGPERLFTTTGIEKAPTVRSNEILPDVNRTNTSAEYYGLRGNSNEGVLAAQDYQESRKVVLPASDHSTISAVGRAVPTAGDYGLNSIKLLNNNKSLNATASNNGLMGQVNGIAKAIFSPLMDILRPTRKEDTINSIRNGNIVGPIPTGAMFNPADRTKTTQREMVESKLDCNHMNVQRQNSDAYLVSKHQALGLQRDTTNKQYTGSAGPSNVNLNKSYESAYNQHNNVNKTYESRANQGGTQIFNQPTNIDIAKRDNDRINTRSLMPDPISGGTIPSYPDITTRVKVSSSYDQEINTSRISPDLLSAFKNNPYTQTQTGWA